MRNANLMKRGLMSLVFLFGMIFALAQMTVTGSVQDSGGNPVVGTAVKVVGNDAISANTDLEGNYALSVPASAAVNGQVSISVLNNGEPETKTFAYAEGGSTDQVFTLNTGSKAKLADVVVVGYGTAKKQLATGAIDVVSKDDFQEGYVSNADQLIQGKVAGVQINQDGKPQGGATIRIRGGSSLKASNDPLIIVDGLPLDTGQGVSFLNPNDIESVSVLKDASATAIYGTRGANGVIIYTTKRGSKNEWKINYNAQFSLNTVPYDYNQLSSQEFIDLVRTSFGTSATSPYQYLGVTTPGGKVYYDTNWIDEVLKNSMSTMHSISAYGNAFNRIPTRVSGNYTSNPGLLLTSGYERVGGSLVINPTFFDNSLKFTLNANTTHERFKFADEGQISNAMAFDPTKPVMYDGLSFGNGYYEWTTSTGGPQVLAPANPVAALTQRQNVQGQNRYFGNAQLEYTLPFFKDLKLVINGGLDQTIWNGIDNKDIGSRSSTLVSGNYVGQRTDFNGFRENKLLDIYGVYTKNFSNFKTETTVGYSYQRFFSRNFNTGNIYDPTNSIKYVQYPYGENYKMLGFFGRFTTSYNEKYLMTINFRHDATSKFGPNYRWENFPGISLGWIISNEDFLKENRFINSLKLRVAYGKSGNQSVDSYQFIPLYYTGNDSSQYFFDGSWYTPIYPSYYNNELRWETLQDYNFGIDYKILDNKFSGSIDLYYKKTSDLLSEVNIAPGANFRNKGLTNFGDFTNKGIEFSVNYNAIKNDKIDLSFSYNIAYNEREVTSLSNSSFLNDGNINGLIDQYISYNAVGEAPKSFFVYEQVYDGSGKPIEGVFVDRNGDGVLNDSDRYFAGNPYPKFNMGLRTDLNVGKFSFAMNWRAAFGHKIYNNIKASNAFLSNVSAGGNPFVTNVLDYYYDANFIQKTASKMQSDYFIEDGSYVKLDNLSLSYNFGNAFGEKTNFTLSLSGNNLVIITKADVNDPEVYDGIVYNLFPRAKMYVLGLNFTF